MKTTTLLLTFLFLLNFSFAQELKIKYDVIMESSDPEMQDQLHMSEGSTLTVYVKDELSRTEMNMGGLMKTSTILDVKKKKGLTLMEGMFGKQGATFEGEDFDKFNEDETDLEIEFTNDTKEILGYTCKKALIYMEEEDVEMVFWYTEEIKISDAYLGEYSKYGIPGMALEYAFQQPEATMKFVAVKMETSIKDSKGLFDLNIPEGYTKTSYKEISNMSGQ